MEFCSLKSLWILKKLKLIIFNVPPMEGKDCSWIPTWTSLVLVLVSCMIDISLTHELWLDSYYTRLA